MFVKHFVFAVIQILNVIIINPIILATLEDSLRRLNDMSINIEKQMIHDTILI